MDRWPSGLRRSPAKGVRGKLLRGFESHPVRHDTKHLQKLTLLYSVNLKQTFYLSDLAREYKYKVEKSFIDFNGHLAEFGYYFYGVDGLRKLCEDKGCTPELYEELKIGPITFQTTVSFKKEVRENSVIIVNPRIISISEDCKKWSSQSDILNENQDLCASIASNGAFMDHTSRKVVPPPKKLQEKWRLLLEVS